MESPIIVSLRPWQKDDRQSLAVLANNFEIWKNLRDRMPHPYLPAHAAQFIHYCSRLSPPSVLAITAGDQFAGCIGLEPQDDVYRFNAELGYWIGEPFWGKGIATQAVATFLSYVHETFPHLHRIYASVFEYNLPSMRVLEKNGFHLEGIRKKAVFKNGAYWDDHLYVLFNPLKK